MDPNHLKDISYAEGKQQAIPCWVDRIREERTRCMVSFVGTPVAVSFPTSVIKELGLEETDPFWWSPAYGRDVLASDIEVAPRYHPILDDEEAIKRFVHGYDP